MQNEREKQGGRFFALIQKLNFIFADESFNETNLFFFYAYAHIENSDLIFVIRREWGSCVSHCTFLQGDFCVQFDGSSLDVANEFRELLYDAMCDDVGTGGRSWR